MLLMPLVDATCPHLMRSCREVPRMVAQAPGAKRELGCSPGLLATTVKHDWRRRTWLWRAVGLLYFVAWFVAARNAEIVLGRTTLRMP